MRFDSRRESTGVQSTSILDETERLALVIAIREHPESRARRATGDTFDEMVLEVLTELWPKPVAAFEVRARLGGPRWKLQASLGRLVAARRAFRRGKTSGVRYAAAAVKSI